MKTVIFSDAHLRASADGCEKTAQLIAFLRGIDPGQVKHVIVLGDLFDFWFEYRHVIFSGYFEVLRVFADLRDKGIRFSFVCGNHDFWAGRFLREQLGFDIYRDRLMIHADAGRVLLVHGDGFNPEDVGYRLYKRIARAKWVIFLFGLLHPDWAMAIARCVSSTSRRLAQTKDLSHGAEVTPLREFARRTLAAGEADVVVCGHSHFPVREEYPTPNGTGLYVNTGDWLYHKSYVEWEGADFRICSFQGDLPRSQ